ncbi:hypothetical protein EYF80_002407 [Liparis tanakae]|uniref:Uncharacterized protein n=1 Tax=Liparis tanakae TaxID=230148 RepID=A0A4Z2JA31_9TELE|nr:hypothetical protein EYF80_002407 [Liparis tanakae]
MEKEKEVCTGLLRRQNETRALSVAVDSDSRARCSASSLWLWPDVLYQSPMWAVCGASCSGALPYPPSKQASIVRDCGLVASGEETGSQGGTRRAAVLANRERHQRTSLATLLLHPKPPYPPLYMCRKERGPCPHQNRATHGHIAPISIKRMAVQGTWMAQGQVSALNNCNRLLTGADGDESGRTVLPVKLVSYQLEFLANACLHTVGHRLLPRAVFRFFSFEIRYVVSLTEEEWSGLLCDATGQHAVVVCQGRARCLRAPVFTLYLPECGAPAIGVWLKHILLLIVHARALSDEQPLKVTERKRVFRHVDGKFPIARDRFHAATLLICSSVALPPAPTSRCLSLSCDHPTTGLREKSRVSASSVLPELERPLGSDFVPPVASRYIAQPRMARCGLPYSGDTLKSSNSQTAGYTFMSSEKNQLKGLSSSFSNILPAGYSWAGVFSKSLGFI